MSSSLYQDMKLDILSVVGLSKDAVHIYIGLLCFFMYLILFRKRVGSWLSLLPVALLALLMEALDLRDDFQVLGHFRWSASFHDMINTLFWPFAIVVLFRLRILKTKDLNDDL